MKHTTELKMQEYLKYKDFLKECSKKVYESQEVKHKHHIIPKCMGGTDKKTNLVFLSVNDHIKAHLLLAECFDDESKEQISNLRSARVLNRKSIKVQATLEKISESYRGENNPFFGKYHSKDVIDKIIERNKKRKGMTYENIYGVNSENERQKRSLANKNIWKNRSQEQRQEITNKTSAKLKGKTPWNKGKGTRIQIDGVVFDSIELACEHYQTTRFFLRKKYNILILEE